MSGPIGHPSTFELHRSRFGRCFEGISQMKNLSWLYSVCLMLSLTSWASGQGLAKCFRAEWLQGERSVNLTISGSKVSGTFSVRAGDLSSDKSYEFTGTMRGNTLTVAFTGNQLPDVAPSEMKSLVWTLVQARGQESLRIQFYGKNYITNKYETRFENFESCTPGYTVLAKMAQTVQFAKGANSASMPLQTLTGFQAMKPAAFWLKASQGQALEIKADGCSVEVYLPNRSIYKFVEWSSKTEKTYGTSHLDGLVIDRLPLTGAYLVVLRKAAENMRPEAVTFKVTN
jgi:hypothetical protein